MTKSVNSSPVTIDQLKRRFGLGEEADRQPLTESDVAQILLDLEAADEHVRAAALCRLSPCPMPWAVFEPLRKALKQLHKDPSQTVRNLALHIEQNAEAIATREALRNLLEDDDDDDGQDEWKQRERKRNKQRHRRRSDNDSD